MLLFIFSTAMALKVLVAGDQHTTWFETLAIKVRADGHTVFKLSRYLEPVFKAQSNEGITLYGIGKHANKFRPQQGT
jgi:hypothetical protein